MYLLLNTCGVEGIVALSEAGKIRAEERLPARGTSEHLMPAIRRVLGEVKVGELAGVGVVAGPGSFTGVRVGLSAAKGLCEAGGVRMVCLSRLELLAWGCRSVGEGTTIALLDGGRGEFYCGLYRDAERVWEQISERLIGREEGVSLLAKGTAVTCDQRVAEALGAQVSVVGEPAGAEMLDLVKERVRAGAWSDVATADANYLRRTDAELAVEKRVG